MLEISVAAGEAGPVLTLSGEADLTTVADLTEALTAQLAIGTRHLTVDLSGLRFMDTSAIHVLVSVNNRVMAGGGLLVTKLGNDRVRFVDAGLDQVFGNVGRTLSRVRSGRLWRTWERGAPGSTSISRASTTRCGPTRTASRGWRCCRTATR